MKKILLIALATTLLLLSACAFAEPINVYALKGPTGIGLSYLAAPVITTLICLLFILSGKWKTSRVTVKK